MRAVVVVNRRAKHLRREGPLLDALRESARVIESHDPAALPEIMRAVKTEAPDAVLLAGGDGSYMAGVSALVAAYGDTPLPIIGLGPGGTVCTIARNWGMRGDLVRYTRKWLASTASTARPSLRVGDRVGFIFGAGLVARAFEVYEREGARGRRGAASIVLRVFASALVGGRFAKQILAPATCAVTIDETKRYERLSLVAASVVPDLGVHLRLTPRAAEEKERFHAVATRMPPRALAAQLPRVLAGRSLAGDRFDGLARHLELRFPRGEGAWVLDGDLVRTDHVVVEAGPVLRILDVT